MQKKIPLFILLIAVVFLVGFIFLNNRSSVIEAGTEHNVSGWAWSENIGWISFNNTTGGGTVNYGVNIDPTTGIFSGYAWSRGTTADVGGIGWIQFNPAGPYPSAPNYSACLDLPTITTEPCNGIGSYNVGGWARALSGDGWTGWIKLRGTAQDGSSYGVWIDTSLSPPAPAEFRGWAWSDMVVGAISFNCKEGGYNEGTQTYYDICGTSNYKVIIGALNVPPNKPTNLLETWDYCSIQGLSIPTLRWTYSDPDGDPQAAYEIRIDNDSDFSVVEPSEFSASGTTSTEFTPIPSSWASWMSWGTTYWWIVRVKDNQNNWSVWSDPNSFTTPSHPYPWIKFSWAPQFPAVDELTQFADQSSCYDADGLCNNWLWEFPADWEFAIKDEGPPPLYYNQFDQNPLGKFTTSGDKDVYLTAADEDFSCRDKRTITSQLPLPEWKEIAPF